MLWGRGRSRGRSRGVMRCLTVVSRYAVPMEIVWKKQTMALSVRNRKTEEPARRVAAATGEPLLFKGDDLSRTDVHRVRRV